MNTHQTTIRMAVAGLLGMTLLVTSCGDDTTSEAADREVTTTTAMQDDSTADSTTDSTMADEMDDEMSGDAASGPTGAACDAVPKDGSGSFDGMAQDPAATAASNNPLLSTLVTAVTEAGLGDTLNGPGPFTIFAPTNDAFAKIPEADLSAVLADKATLTKILTLHVVAGKMSAADLAAAGSATTVEGQDISFGGEAGSLQVNGQAMVICGDVQVANATVHIIDSVLMPSA